MSTTYGETRYIAWANRRFGSVTHNLARGGMRPVPLGELAMPSDLDDPMSWTKLRDSIARYNAVDAAEVIPALGTTHALWLAFASLLQPGDDVLVEHPAYEPLWRIPRGMGARVHFFERSWDAAFALTPDAVAAKLTPRTRVVVVTNPHNPTGSRSSPDELRAIAELCAGVGATLLVDEIYGAYGAVLADEGILGACARHCAPNVAAVSGLSKAYGLGALRVGWLLAQPSVVRRADDALQSNLGDPPLAQANFAAHAFSHLRELSARREKHFRPELRATVASWIASHPELSWQEPEQGPFGFVYVRGGGDITAAIEEGADRHDVLVAPGSFFGVPQAFRLGWAVSSESLPAALACLDRVVDTIRCTDPCRTS